MPAAATGYITRSNLPSPLSNLAIAVDPLWLLPGDSSDDAAASSGAGLTAGPSQMQYVWASSPFVKGKQLVNAVADNSTVDLRLICDGHGSIASAATYAGEVITAITEQMIFQLSVTLDTQQFAWNCYPGVYQVAYNEVYTFGYALPLYISCPRDPTPVAGPI